MSEETNSDVLGDLPPPPFPPNCPLLTSYSSLFTVSPGILIIWLFTNTR